MTDLPAPNPTIAVNPSQASIGALAARPDHDAIIMLNLLRYAPDGGRDAYARYGAVAGPCVVKRGGGPVYSGEVVGGNSSWDTVLLVRYPRRAAYLDLQTDPAYVGVIPERTAGLDARLLHPFHDPDGDPDDPFVVPRARDADDESVLSVRLRRTGGPMGSGELVLHLRADMAMVSDDAWHDMVVMRHPSLDQAQAAAGADDMTMICRP